MILLHTQTQLKPSGLWLDNCGYFISQWDFFVIKEASSWFQKIWYNKEIPQGGKN